MLLITDLFIVPTIIVSAILVKSILQSLGMNNQVIFMSCFFLVIHLLMTLLMRFQLRDVEDHYLGKNEFSAFAAVITAGCVSLTYIVTGLLPILKSPFFLLKYLPTSQYWYDLLIVSLPGLASHVLARLIGRSLLD